MTVRIKNILFISGIVLLFLTLWVVSLLADENKGYTGLSEKTALSPDDKNVVFSSFKDGDAILCIVPVTGGKAEILAEPEKGMSYINPTFSPDGKKVVFIKQWEEDKQPFGEVMMIDLESENVQALTDGGEHVTDAAFSSNGKKLFILQSSTYENYSPIASEHPHGFDIYQIDMASQNVKQVTDKEAYEMSDIAVTPDGEKLIYHSYRDDDVIVVYSLEEKQDTIIKPKGSDLKEAIISAPALSPDGKDIAFSGVAGQDENGTFTYEGFIMNVKTEKARQITSFHEHVTNPVFYNHQNRLLITVNKNFAGSEPEYSYWLVDLDKKDSRQRLEVSVPKDDES